MNFQVATILVLFFMKLSDVRGMRHLVYWDKKLIPSLSKEGLTITLEINDWMDVLCPYFESPDTSRVAARKEYLMIYNVTEKEFQHCDTRRGMMLQVCDDPFSEKKLTTKFQERSPSPFGFTFRPGATYYYVSKPLHDGRNHGCNANTMKMKINVKQKGTVFAIDDRDTTKTYHEQDSKKTSTQFQLKTTTTRPTSLNVKRHHHHQRPTKSVMPSTRPLFQIIGNGKSTPKFASGGKNSQQSQKNDPENFGHGVMHQSRMSSFILFVVGISLTLALQRT